MCGDPFLLKPLCHGPSVLIATLGLGLRLCLPAPSLEAGSAGSRFNSYPLTERDVGCPRESLHCFGQGLRKHIRQSSGRTGAWILQMTPLPKPEGLGLLSPPQPLSPNPSSLSSLPRLICSLNKYDWICLISHYKFNSFGEAGPWIGSSVPLLLSWQIRSCSRESWVTAWGK